LRPTLMDTRPPLGARDITLRTRVVVATTGVSFATAGIMLNVLVDFDSTPAPTLFGFLATAAALVICSALIGSLVGEDTAPGLGDVRGADRWDRGRGPRARGRCGDGA